MFVHNFKYPLPKISKNDIVVQFDGHQKSILSEISITETNLLLILKLKVLQTIFLLQALTHASYTLNKITESCERLEFLGDAILGYLITCHLVTKNQNLTQGEITDMRSALDSNNNLADIAVRNGLHRHLLQQSPELFRRYTYLKLILYQGSFNNYVDKGGRGGQ